TKSTPRQRVSASPSGRRPVSASRRAACGFALKSNVRKALPARAGSRGQATSPPTHLRADALINQLAALVEIARRLLVVLDAHPADLARLHCGHRSRRLGAGRLRRYDIGGVRTADRRSHGGGGRRGLAGAARLEASRKRERANGDESEVAPRFARAPPW